jgi:prevent-host-death family protein
MTITENIYSAKTHLSQLVHRALKGDEVIIAKAGHPLVCLVPYHARHPLRRTPGTACGQFELSDDFDAPLPESELGAWER